MGLHFFTLHLFVFSDLKNSTAAKAGIGTNTTAIPETVSAGVSV